MIVLVDNQGILVLTEAYIGNHYILMSINFF